MPYGPQILWPDHGVAGTPNAALHAGLPQAAIQMVLRKGTNRDLDSYSAFFENDRSTPTGLGGYLRERGLTHVLLAGLAMVRALDLLVAHGIEFWIAVAMALVFAALVMALTAWLVDRYGIRLGDVIGHNESLTSRFHRERYTGWRCQTHGDWVRADMDVYRTRLRAVLRERLRERLRESVTRRPLLVPPGRLRPSPRLPPALSAARERRRRLRGWLRARRQHPS